MARGKNLLTDREVTYAKTENKDMWLNDGGGLYVHIRPNGTKTWRYRYTVNGTRRILDIGDAQVIGMKMARNIVDEARKLVEQGICPIEHKKSEIEQKAKLDAENQILQEIEIREQRNRRSLSDAVERWAEIELSKRSDGGKEPMRAIRKDVLSALGDRDLVSVKRGDILEILDTIKQRGADRMANRVFTDMKQFFRWAFDRELIPSDPLQGLGKARVSGKDVERDRFLSAEEIRELNEKLPTALFERPTELVIWIMLSTLCRVGEVIQARWEHVDLDNREWFIPAENAKNKKNHTIFLSDFTLQKFQELRAISHWSDWMLPSVLTDNRHICLKSITRQVRDRQRDNSLSKRTKATGTLILAGGTWTPHDLRRTGASMMAELGILPDIIERCLNHVEQDRMKRIYQRHDYRAERRDAFNQLGCRLDELINGKSRKVVSIREAVGY